MKKILAAALAGAMLLTAVPAVTYADGIEYITEEISLFSSDDAITPFYVVPEDTINLEDWQINKIEEIVINAISNDNSTDIDLTGLGLTFNPTTGGSSNDVSRPVSDVIDNFFADHPEYFYVSRSTGSVKISGTQDPMTGEVTIISIGGILVYTEDYDIPERIAAVEEKAKEIIDAMNVSDIDPESDFDKALWLHDYIVNTITYDWTYEDRTLDKAILDGSAVCEGYAAAYKYLMTEAGVECVNVYHDNPIPNEPGHKWSAVNLDGEWYHVDTTQDDPDWLGHVSRTYFLLTDDEILNTNDDHATFYYTDTKIACDDITYSTAPWRSAGSTIIFMGNDRYYGAYTDESKPMIYKADSDFAEVTEFFEIPSGGMSVSIYTNGLGAYKNKLYFNNSSKLMSLDVGTKQTEILYPTDETLPTDIIFIGSRVDGGTMYYEERKVESINQKGEIKSISLTDHFTVTFKDGEETIGTVTVTDGDKLDIPDYVKFGNVVEGWYTDKACEGGKWDFTTTVTDDITLYAKILPTEWSIRPSFGYSGGHIIGNMHISLKGFNENTQKAPLYMIAVYDGETVTAVRTSRDGYFSFSRDDEVAYNFSTSSIKAFAWNGNMKPFIGATDCSLSAPSGGSSGGGSGGSSNPDENEDE